MVFVVVDNNQSDLDETSDIIINGFDDSEIQAFLDPMLAVKYICNNDIDFVISNVGIRHISETVFINIIRRQKPEIPIFMISDNKMNCSMMNNFDADEFFTKPLSASELRTAIDNYRDSIY